MNKYVIAVLAVTFGSPLIAARFDLNDSQGILMFGLIAVLCAPVIIHKVPHAGLAVGMLFGMSSMASYPLRELFQIHGFGNEAPVKLAYFASLWIIGFGWKRRWLPWPP